MLSAAWSEATRQSGCGTETSTTEAPTDVCHVLTASQSCCTVGGSAVDSSHAVWGWYLYTVRKLAIACWKHGDLKIVV